MKLVVRLPLLCAFVVLFAVNAFPNASTAIACEMERRIFLAGFYKAFGLGNGPCPLCAKCNTRGCIHTEQARPAKEACGIDVYTTVRANGYPIKVVKDNSDDANYYGLVLIE
jgi:predicted metal-binding protein